MIERADVGACEGYAPDDVSKVDSAGKNHLRSRPRFHPELRGTFGSPSARIDLMLFLWALDVSVHVGKNP